MVSNSLWLLEHVGTSSHGRRWVRLHSEPKDSEYFLAELLGLASQLLVPWSMRIQSVSKALDLSALALKD